MAFEVDHAYGGRGYLVSIGVGKKFRAADLDEVKVAMEHYFLGYGEHDTSSCIFCKEPK